METNPAVFDAAWGGEIGRQHRAVHPCEPRRFDWRRVREGRAEFGGKLLFDETLDRSLAAAADQGLERLSALGQRPAQVALR